MYESWSWRWSSVRPFKLLGDVVTWTTYVMVRSALWSLDWQEAFYSYILYIHRYIYTIVMNKTKIISVHKEPDFWKWLCRMPTSKIVNIDVMYCRLWPRQVTDRLLVREGAPHRQNRNCLTVTKIWSWAPEPPEWPWHQDWLAGLPSVVMWLWLELQSVVADC
jgi:hypothetical protein